MYVNISLHHIDLHDVIIYRYDFYCLGIMYAGEKDVCGVALTLYPHRASWKIWLTRLGIEPTTFGMLAQCSANRATCQVCSSKRYFKTESSSFDISVIL